MSQTTSDLDVSGAHPRLAELLVRSVIVVSVSARRRYVAESR